MHGVARATFDLDILIDPTKENAARLLKALEAAGLGTAALTDVDDLLAHEITVFSDRVRIDVQTRTPGLTFADAWARRQTMTYESQTFFVVSRADLIASKRAAGCPRDLEDVRGSLQLKAKLDRLADALRERVVAARRTRMRPGRRGDRGPAHCRLAGGG